MGFSDGYIRPSSLDNERFWARGSVFPEILIALRRLVSQLSSFCGGAEIVGMNEMSQLLGSEEDRVRSAEQMRLQPNRVGFKLIECYEICSPAVCDVG